MHRTVIAVWALPRDCDEVSGVSLIVLLAWLRPLALTVRSGQKRLRRFMEQEFSP